MLYIKDLEKVAGGIHVVHGICRTSRMRKWQEDVVMAMGSLEGLRVLRMIVEDCFVYKVSAGSLITKIKEMGVHEPGKCYKGGCTWCGRKSNALGTP
ncbi:hypothetical protein Pyn_27509 [Prunus yedoensis var. nudiflora]|uniref:Uncharacterized protein n=1 Tax=Prunus yedoensis var. nudiflora TaxID=2094558 RepID=A0A314ZRQ6_PRUYE|nr:hypothetical protein Pyn_27509 [Prunus yedoensis var. nudiflora]